MKPSNRTVGSHLFISSLITLFLAGSAFAQSAADFSRTSQAIVTGSGQTQPQDATTSEKLDKVIKQLDSVIRRLDRIEGARGTAELAAEDKNKALLTNLDIITKGEQRVDQLRKQLFDIIEREGATKSKLDQVELDLRPEAIERSLAFTGSLRPEDAREARRRSLDSERRSLQASLSDIQALRAGLDANMRKAEALVEKLRQKFEKDIEAALEN